MDEEIKTGEMLRLWWCFAWRFTLGSFGLSFVAGFVIGVVASMSQVGDMERVKMLAQIAGFVIGLIWSLFALFMALNKKYRGFRLAVVRGDLPLCRWE